MSRIKQLVTQTGTDVFTSIPVFTGLTVDGKAGWRIRSIEASWSDGSSVSAGDYLLVASVGTVATVTAYGDDDELGRVSWGLQNTAGVAVAIPYEPVKIRELSEERVTVQDQLFFGVSSAATGQANDVVIVVNYDVIKLTDLEVLRLLAGGA